MRHQLLKTPFDKLRANGGFNQCFPSARQLCVAFRYFKQSVTLATTIALSEASTAITVAQDLLMR
jgi:hypothetical protein